MAHHLLFAAPSGPKVSHFSAFVLLKDCSRWAISRWTLGHYFWHQSKSQLKPSRRGTVAIAVRLLIALVENGILILAVPRNQLVMGHEVGSPRLLFGKTQFGSEDMRTSLEQVQPCRTDPIPYTGFSPSATRYICMKSQPLRGHLRKKAWEDATKLHAVSPVLSDRNVTIVIRDIYSSDFITSSHLIPIDFYNSLQLTVAHPYTATAVQFDIWHKFRRAEGGCFSFLREKGISSNAVDSIVDNVLSPYRKSCTTVLRDVNSSALSCATPGESSTSHSLTVSRIDEIPRYLLQLANTVPTDQDELNTWYHHETVGRVQKPIFEIFPAVGLAAVLFSELRSGILPRPRYHFNRGVSFVS